MKAGGEKSLTLTGLDCVVLLYHLHKYAQKFGHEDADRTLGEVTRLLSFSVQAGKSVIESGMFCCNLLDEEQGFWHPQGATFDEFTRKIGQGRKFNKKYNWFEDKDERGI